MSAARLFGLGPEALPSVRRLGLFLALTTAAEIVVEGAVLSAFIARIGAAALPTALALRAIVEVVLSLGFERGFARGTPSRAMRWAVLGGIGLLVASAAALSSAAGVYATFVVASSLARIKTIHFGVLALNDLPGLEVARALPVVQACGRLGGVAAGPVIALSGPAFGSHWLAAGAAGLYALSLLALKPVGAVAPSIALGQEGDSADHQGSAMLLAILVGAIALALGRLALITQSGAILEHAYGEADLNRVLGAYFTLANLLAFLLQALVVGRVLGAGGLPALNSGWAWLYLGAQAALSFGPASVAVALSARLVESELRNALRTPVANLLYEAVPRGRRAFARTVVIGVAVPAASLVGGLGLRLMDAHPTALSAMGLGAALTIVASTWAQNRAWRRAG